MWPTETTYSQLTARRGSRPQVKPLDENGGTDYDAEQYELLGDEYSHEPLPSPFHRKIKGPAYEEGGVIDWQHEEAAERERKRILASHRGFRGPTARLADDGSMWLVTILSGLGIGTIGAWLDVLVRWCVRLKPQYPIILTRLVRLRLGDLRDGRCTYGFFYNQVMCCSGLDRAQACFVFVGYTDMPCPAGEQCREWQTWSEFLHIKWIFVQSLLQSSVYVLLAVRYLSTLILFHM